MTSKVSIISDAFVLLGLNPINDLETGNPIHAAASGWYDRLILSTLSENQPWRFAMLTKSLDLLAETPVNDDWTYVFQLPTDPKILMLYQTYPSVGYNLYEDKLYANVNELAIDYIFKPDESKFPPHFVTMMTYKVAASIAMLVTQKTELVKLWAQEAVTQTRVSRSADTKQTPNRVINPGQVYLAHFGDAGPSITRVT